MPRGWVAIALVGVVVLVGCQGPFPQSTFAPASEFGESLDTLYMTIFWWAVVVFVVVEGLLVYVVIRFRHKPDRPDPRPIHGHTALEIAWTLAPAMIIVFIAVPTVRTIWRNAAAAPADAMEIQVIGHQWWWEFRYPEYDIATANELHVPRGRPVALLMSSADVIHSFWTPRLGGKRDVILGRTNRLLFTPDSVGEFLGQCAEFCGSSHANMRFKVMVDDAATFERWVVNEQSAAVTRDSLTELEARGLEAFLTIRDPASNSCLACHTVQGVSPGVLGPNLTHVGSRTTIASGVLANTPANMARWLRDPSAVKPGSLMPTVDLNEAEIEALVAYLRRLQ